MKPVQVRKVRPNVVRVEVVPPSDPKTVRVRSHRRSILGAPVRGARFVARHVAFRRPPKDEDVMDLTYHARRMEKLEDAPAREVDL